MSDKFIKVKTNKDQYVSGEAIQISGAVGGLESGKPINIQVLDPKANPYRFEAVPLNATGTYDFLIKVREPESRGSYKVLVTADERNLQAETSFSYSGEVLGQQVILMPKNYQSFSPNNVTIPSGTTVTWLNEDNEVHTATSFDLTTGKLDGKISTDFVPPGKKATLTPFSPTDTKMAYFCTLHPSEIGVVNVSGRFKQAALQKDVPPTQDLIANRQTISAESKRKLAKLVRHFGKENLDLFQYDELAKLKVRILTIVFWDLAGFSKVCEILKGEIDLVGEFLTEYFAKATDIIFKNGGALDKFIGDGVMAIFGFLSRDRDGSSNAISAVNAAIQFKREFEKLKERWIGNWSKYVNVPISLGLKSGINTGSALAGNFGTEEMDQFTAVGTTVNFASRLTDKADDGEILISSTTRNNIGNSFVIKDRGTLANLKNIAGEFRIFEVMG